MKNLLKVSVVLVFVFLFSSTKALNITLYENVGKQDAVIFEFPLNLSEKEIKSKVNLIAKYEGWEVKSIEIKNENNKKIARIETDLHGKKLGIFKRKISIKPLNATVFISLPKIYAISEKVKIVKEDEFRKTYFLTKTSIIYYLPIFYFVLFITLLFIFTFTPFFISKTYAKKVLELQIKNEEKMYKLTKFSIIASFLFPVIFIFFSVFFGILDVISILLSNFVTLGKNSMLIIFFGFYFFIMLLVFSSFYFGILPAERKIRKVKMDKKKTTTLTAKQLALTLSPIFLWLAIVFNLPQVFLKNYIFMFFIFIAFLFFLGAFYSYAFIILGNAKILKNEKLRKTLLELADEFEVKIKDIKITEIFGEKVANAMVSGILPKFRYIFLTDYLLENFDENEIKAIVAHELAHVKKKHLILKEIIAIGWFVFWILLSFLIKNFMKSFLSFTFTFLFAFLFYFLLINGKISLKFEREADILAAKIVGKKYVIKALKKLAKVNVAPRKTGKLFNLITLHPSIEERIKYLEKAS